MGSLSTVGECVFAFGPGASLPFCFWALPSCRRVFRSYTPPFRPSEGAGGEALSEYGVLPDYLFRGRGAGGFLDQNVCRRPRNVCCLLALLSSGGGRPGWPSSRPALGRVSSLSRLTVRNSTWRFISVVFHQTGIQALLFQSQQLEQDTALVAAQDTRLCALAR